MDQEKVKKKNKKIKKKGTIFEAITWCLFDKFIRSDMKINYSINDKNMKKKTCKVEIEFENGYKIIRTRSYNKTMLKIYKDDIYLEDFEKSSTKISMNYFIENILGFFFFFKIIK
jgi:DNA repair exonuclease SbcCD ATPase subunit